MFADIIEAFADEAAEETDDEGADFAEQFDFARSASPSSPNITFKAFHAFNHRSLRIIVAASNASICPSHS